MNRFKFDLERIKIIKKAISNKQSIPILKRFPIKSKDNRLYYEGKPIIPKEDVDAVLTRELGLGLPIAMESGFAYLLKKYWGVKRSVWREFLKNTEPWQKLKTRKLIKPAEHNKTEYVLKSTTPIAGMDLVDLSKTAYSRGFREAYKYLLVCVIKGSNLIFVEVQKNKTKSLQVLDNSIRIQVWSIT